MLLRKAVGKVGGTMEKEPNEKRMRKGEEK
jgi:hypothetical protein